MSFNKGYELKKFEAHWEKLRIEYAAAGMTKEAIQKMYDYDRQQFNSERTFIERTQEFTAPAYESSEEEASPLMLRYQDAITVTDTYHETKSRFAWIGEIENEQLLTALETLKTEDLEIITMYAYEGYDITEISKPADPLPVGKRRVEYAVRCAGRADLHHRQKPGTEVSGASDPRGDAPGG